MIRYISAIPGKTCILLLITTVTSIVFQRNGEMSVKWKDTSTVEIRSPTHKGME